jgi:hypothetical protein
MKYILVSLLALTVIGCGDGMPHTQTVSHAYELPNELKDCTVSYMTSPTHYNLTVIRCPNSSVTTEWTEHQGKSTVQRTSITIDGIEYQKVEK